MKRDGGSYRLALGDDELSYTPRPYEDERFSKEDIRNAQLEVARHCDNADDLRFWLTGLGLIPDTYPEPKNWKANSRRHRARRPKE